nr:mobilization protein [uncultured Campylobacter sp.]
MDNGAKSSFNIELMKPTGFYHNFRRGFLAKDVRGDLSHENEYTCYFFEARQRAAQMKADADAAYLARTGRRPKYDEKKIYWEAEVNAREWHTVEDLKRAAAVIEKEMGYRFIYGVIHKDEGHNNDEGEFIKNVQFHIAFISLDENGISQHRKTFNPSLMSKIQTKIAQTLGMERGIPKEITERTHLPPRQYKQAIKIAEPIKQELQIAKADLADAKAKIKALEESLKSANKQARADLQTQGGKREDYAALEQENKQLKNELAELKKMPDLDNLEDFEKTFREKISKLRNHPKINVEVEKAIKANNLRSGILGNFDKNSIMAYIADSVAIKHAAQSVIKEAQTALTELATKKEISVKAQLMAVRENKTLGGFLGAASRSDADVSVLKREKAALVDTVDQLQKQNKALQKTLKATSEIVSQKDAQIAELQKNQEGLSSANDSFYLGQAVMLSELIANKKLYIEPKGQSLVVGLDSIVSGEYPAKNFEGIKSGLLSYCPPFFTTQNNNLEYTR